MTALLAAYRWAVTLLRRMFDWLRRPGNTAKAAIGAVLLALIYWGATASLRSYAQGQRITVLITERDDAVAATAEARALLEGERAEWQVFRAPDFDMLREKLAAPVIFDGRNLYDPGRLARKGFAYYAIGRGLAT